jgi:hypothetical protein
MNKKIKLFIIKMITLLNVFGIVACTENLDNYKKTKMNELQEYADSKDEDNYSIENWQIICQAVLEGKTAISAGKSKSVVDISYTIAKNVIDVVQKENEKMEVEFSIVLK